MSPHISILILLILTSMVVTLPSTVSLASRSLTCLPSSSSLEVPSEGELKVQCNVAVPEEQVRFSSMFFLDDYDDHDDHDDYDVLYEDELKVQCNVTVPEEQVRFQTRCLGSNLLSST